jgi:hypothetical protein
MQGMSKPTAELFQIVGEEGPVLQRVRAAMEWLLSPKAKGIGEKLLRDAHAQRPSATLLISAPTEAYTQYNRMRHAIFFNATSLDRHLRRAPNGTLQPMSVECTLAHELVHAGQSIAHVVGRHTGYNHAYVEINSTDRILEMRKKSHEYREAAKKALYRTTALSNLEKGARIAVKADDLVIEAMKKHPDVVDYVINVEMPAVAVENEVANLRGEPTRNDYLSSILTRKERTERWVHNNACHLKVDEKPEKPVSGIMRWVGLLNDRSGRGLGG